MEFGPSVVPLVRYVVAPLPDGVRPEVRDVIAHFRELIFMLQVYLFQIFPKSVAGRLIVFTTTEKLGPASGVGGDLRKDYEIFKKSKFRANPPLNWIKVLSNGGGKTNYV